jgi:FMN phosphatase YigB (HAD superfamily)
LLDPPKSTIDTLVALRERGLRLGVLSNTHALELRAWDQSPIACLVDAVALSHQLGACKPDPASYSYVLNRLDVPAAAAVYVGDGGNDELLGARAAGFGMVVLAEMAPARFALDDLPLLRSQADVSVTSSRAHRAKRRPISSACWALALVLGDAPGEAWPSDEQAARPPASTTRTAYTTRGR